MGDFEWLGGGGSGEKCGKWLKNGEKREEEKKEGDSVIESDFLGYNGASSDRVGKLSEFNGLGGKESMW